MVKKTKKIRHSKTKTLLFAFVKNKEKCVIFKKGAFPLIDDYIKDSERMRLTFNYFEIGVGYSNVSGLYISSFNGGKCYLMEKKLFLAVCKNRGIEVTDELYKQDLIYDYGIKNLPISKSAKKNVVTIRNSNISGLLDIHNTESYMADNAIIAKLTATYSTKDWIETRRSALQMQANVYERNLGAYLINNDIRFIHQAPFIINKRIYFLDFYLPHKRIAIEVDGISHESIKSNERDINRDKDFATIGVKTYRISNAQTKNTKDIETFLKGHGII